MPIIDSSARACAQVGDLKTKIGPVDFLKALFAYTTGPVYICSFANERDDPTQASERHVITRKPVEIEAFAKKWDKPGRGLFFCLASMKPGIQRRSKDGVEQSIGLFADIDFNKVDGLGSDPRAEVLQKLGRLRILPSATVSSGGGVHAYWLFKEPMDTQLERERIESALRQLADIVAGDLPVCEVSRVLRLPGSHNTKDGAWNDVEITSFDPDRRYELDDLEEWFSEQSPVMLRKVRQRGATVHEIEDDFFAQYAKQFDIKAPIDVEARLNAMIYMGSGENSIHQTQIQCAASMLSRGMAIDEVVAILLAATKVAAGDYGKRWNWRIEERNIRKDCESWIKKHPPEKKTPRAERQRAAEQPAPKSMPFTVIEGGAATAAIEQPIIMPSPKADELHAVLGKAVLDKMAHSGDQMINTKDGTWFYTAGVWELRVEPKWLNVRIEETCQGLGFKSTTKITNETRNWIERRPSLWRESEIPWDQHGKIPTRSGLVDPRTGELEIARADHFCTWRIDFDYDPAATCPWWETMIADMFGDKDDQRDLVRVVQELFGCALIDKKPRSLSKACVFWGIQNLGKSGPLDVIAGLFGKSISAPIGSVEGTHGLMSFQHRAPWVLHEAFNGQWNFSTNVKSIITQDPVQINVKNGPMINTVIRAPIFWATNFQPQFKEPTRAIVDRMIVIEVSRQFSNRKPIGAAAEALRQGFSKPGELVVATELPGVLNWATAGLRRALERGSIETTNAIEETADAIHKDSNLVAGFLADCVEFDPMARLRSSDFCLAHSAWWLELKGEARRLPTNEAVAKALKAMGDARIGMDRNEMRDSASRYYCGIALNAAGLRYHRAAYESRLFEGKTATATDPAREVNSLIPVSWNDRETIVKMRAGHDTGSQMDRGSLTGDRESGVRTFLVTTPVIGASP
ncbi:DNA-primase RepB domain-containing protein [Bradyrhizobium sp. 76]|uniref:DNA-primase RepB domain-containing protein n=1 Tax=Bradyrhizobium sp. 76 TaxID=2782680 RepID=UPI001FF90A22|nr:DNA-primase RepB domain-containing protein [Bradyrhizobium sp. 76]MCK1404142.1 hypothetical protein [Bradyrhizobium sp. 76]